MNEETFSTGGTAGPDIYSGSFRGQSGGSQSEDQGQSGVARRAEETARSAGEEFDKLKGAAREQAGTAVEQVKAGAQSAMHQAQEAGRSFISGQKDTLAKKVDGYADAVRAVSERLQGEEGNVLAGPAGQAAEQLGRLSGYLREKEPADFLDDLEVLARRRPEVVFGGLFVAGLAAARFLKASRRRSSAQYSGAASGAAYRTPGPRPIPPAPGTHAGTSAGGTYASGSAVSAGAAAGSGTDDPFTPSTATTSIPSSMPGSVTTLPAI